LSCCTHFTPLWGAKNEFLSCSETLEARGVKKGEKKEKGVVVVVVVVVAVVARGNKGATRTRLLALQGQLGHLG